MSEVASKAFGHLPLRIVHDILLLEATVLLGSTDRSVSEIAHHLYFDDQPLFTHFVKKGTGFSRQKVRRKR